MGSGTCVVLVLEAIDEQSVSIHRTAQEAESAAIDELDELVRSHSPSGTRITPLPRVLIDALGLAEDVLGDVYIRIHENIPLPRSLEVPNPSTVLVFVTKHGETATTHATKDEARAVALEALQNTWSSRLEELKQMGIPESDWPQPTELPDDFEAAYTRVQEVYLDVDVAFHES